MNLVLKERREILSYRNAWVINDTYVHYTLYYFYILFIMHNKYFNKLYDTFKYDVKY